jgi:hypothetical protein
MTLPHLYSGTQQLFMLRQMLVREEGGTLILCDAIPRAWLQPGKRTAVTNAATPWGPVSFAIESLKGRREIGVRVDLPRRSRPEAVRLRVRTPDGSPLRSVRVNGAKWSDYTRDSVTLPPGRATCRVTVGY